MQKFTFLLFILISIGNTMAQKPINPAKPTNIDKSSISIKTDHRNTIPKTNSGIFDQHRFNYEHPLHFQKISPNLRLQFKLDKASGLPVMINGVLKSPDRNASIEAKCYAYLDAISEQIRIGAPQDEFLIEKESTNDQGIRHIRMEQYYQGLKVHGGQIVLHEKDGDIYLFNGRHYPSPVIEELNPSFDLEMASNIVRQDFSNWQELDHDQLLLVAHEQLKAELVIYHLDKAIHQEKLAWHIIAIPNITERWEYFIDAQNGEILHKFSNICKIHTGFCTHTDHPVETKKDLAKKPGLKPVFGPETAIATDLSGINRTINVYETGGTYFMIDASRTMFNPALSNLPNNPSGVIWSINAFNTFPENSNFSYDHISSNDNSWDNPTAVSAHYNGGIAYEYFKNTFGRESINGNGGNIVSFINVADSDGSSMDNAFWNGAAMFYGNGNQAFNAPLAKALDVAGHEMSHGVIQNEANLEYQFESGALNESFADIFGAMIDRDDWKIGEEVANPTVFPSGTMRDMEDPNNGGTSNDFYWQPKHVNEQYMGSQNNGGVHINSGIPNHAYYLFATAIGKDKAEEIYYEVLTNYLVASSQFIDLRYAVVQATIQEYGANSPEVAAANSAFDAVGIGEGGGNDYQEDIAVNPGTDFIMWSDLGLNNINNAFPDGSFDETFSGTNHISRPSITDDGSIILFIDENNDMIEIDVDWSTGQILNEYTINDAGIWRNVATSKDGSKLAAITTDNDNEIFVFDFNTNTSQWFELYNPTSAEGISTGDVQFPDVLEWDFSGQYILYDAQNIISGQNSDISYWDIGFLRVWDNDINDFGDGFVSKLFSGLPENVSVGNPTFSKNSPYIIAFDLIESTSQGTNYQVLGANIQTGDQGLIWQNNTLGYPSFSIDDSQMIFTAINNNQSVIGIRSLNSDKINGTGDANLLIENAEWATWFATGERDLNTSTEDFNVLSGINIYPNPVAQTLIIEWLSNEIPQGNYELFDLRGRTIAKGIINDQRTSLELSNINAGQYFLRIFNENRMTVKKISKF